MRVFKLADGTSWVARLHESPEQGTAESRAGWEAIVFQATPSQVAQLVYRPNGWLGAATVEELAAALQDGVAIRVRWGG